MGFDLSKNPYAMNESIRILTRTFVPFIVLIVVSLFTRPDDKKMLDRFFVKMKTPVNTDHVEDAKQMVESYSNPHRFDHKKLFPNSNWELDKWDRTDIVGFSISILGVLGVIALMIFLISVGG